MAANETADELRKQFVQHARGGCEICLTALRQMKVNTTLFDDDGPLALEYCPEGNRLVTAMVAATEEKS